MCWLLTRNMTSCITLYHHQGFTFNCVMSVVMHGVISFLLSIVIINTLIVTTCCCCCCWNNYSTNYYDIVCWLCCWTFLLGSITIIIWLLILAQFLPAESVIVFNHPGNEPVPFVIVFLGHDWRTIHNQGSTGSYESILGGDWCPVTMTSEIIIATTGDNLEQQLKQQDLKTLQAKLKLFDSTDNWYIYKMVDWWIRILNWSWLTLMRTKKYGNYPRHKVIHMCQQIIKIRQ